MADGATGALGSVVQWARLAARDALREDMEDVRPFMNGAPGSVISDRSLACDDGRKTQHCSEVLSSAFLFSFCLGWFPDFLMLYTLLSHFFSTRSTLPRDRNKLGAMPTYAYLCCRSCDGAR